MDFRSAEGVWSIFDLPDPLPFCWEGDIQARTRPVLRTFFKKTLGRYICSGFRNVKVIVVMCLLVPEIPDSLWQYGGQVGESRTSTSTPILVGGWVRTPSPRLTPFPSSPPSSGSAAPHRRDACEGPSGISSRMRIVRLPLARALLGERLAVVGGTSWRCVLRHLWRDPALALVLVF